MATTTNTSPTGAQVFVFNARGNLFQPKGGHDPAWPRYNRLSGRGNDLHFNKVGNHGYGAYGENVAHRQHRRRPRAGDHHHLRQPPDQRVQPRRHVDPGVAVVHQPRVRRRSAGGWAGGSSSGGPTHGVERRHYHLHTGALAEPGTPGMAAVDRSPPAVADLDGDGRNEVVGIPNVEKHIPYRTQGYAFMVLDGAYGDGHRSARRHRGLRDAADVQPSPSTDPTATGTRPAGSPPRPWSTSSATRRPEIVAALPGGKVYAVGPAGHRLWSYRYAPRRAKTFASEVVAADLNKDGRPELVFGTYALHRNAGRLIVLSAHGRKLSVTRLRHQAPRRQRHRRTRRAVDRRPHRERHARDRPDHLRPRRRRLHGPRLRHRLPAVAHRARQPPPQRHGPGHCALTPLRSHDWAGWMNAVAG